MFRQLPEFRLSSLVSGFPWTEIYKTQMCRVFSGTLWRTHLYPCICDMSTSDITATPSWERFNRGCQCCVRVPTRWRLHAMFLKLLCCSVTEELRGVLRLVCTPMHDVSRMYTQNDYPSDGGHRKMTDSLYILHNTQSFLSCHPSIHHPISK